MFSFLLTMLWNKDSDPNLKYLQDLKKLSELISIIAQRALKFILRIYSPKLTMLVLHSPVANISPGPFSIFFLQCY